MVKSILAFALLLAITSTASAIECRSSVPAGAKDYWAYRVIDGERCWYRGEKGMAKSKLFWREATKVAHSQRRVATKMAIVTDAPLVPTRVATTSIQPTLWDFAEAALASAPVPDVMADATPVQNIDTKWPTMETRNFDGMAFLLNAINRADDPIERERFSLRALPRHAAGTATPPNGMGWYAASAAGAFLSFFGMIAFQDRDKAWEASLRASQANLKAKTV